MIAAFGTSAGGVAVVIPLNPLPDPPWTVEAGGWKLIIRDGAMIGLERTG